MPRNASQAASSPKETPSAAINSQASEALMTQILDQAKDLSDSGKFAKALVLVRQLTEQAGDFSDKPQFQYDVLDFQHYLLLRTGAFQEALQTGFKLEDLGRKVSERESPWDCLKIADAYLGLKDDNKALDWIEKAVRERNFTQLEVLQGEDFARLRQYPRFRELLATIEKSLGLGLPALDFRITLLDGTPFALSAQAGKVVLIDFWDVRCLPCRRAMPHLKELHQKFAAQGLLIVGISLDTDKRRLDDYLKQMEISWATACSFKGWNDETVKLYRINSTPSTWLIDRQGILRSINLSGEKLTKAIMELL
jgi:thiol-disulfide isomerase/thioredoxin